MSEAGLSKMSIDGLLDAFVRLSAARGIAMDLSKVSETNRLGAKIGKIEDELKRRPGDQRFVLAKNFAHPNPYVRFSTATCLIEVMPEEARRQLQLIADSKYYPLAGDAGMYLSNLDSGFFERGALSR
ncbi:MAG: DUF2019 domain-containing protein [Rhodopseudomonas sp.]|uniref:DUF2019 domain-containing protein n=1 Tax=Rhodopseudomonas sp. TaxID=1078 RepID=UPI0017AA8D05|nr:DUF2019 domain-containing protein [Rhodopseudomonas sp.]NVN87017.1 DUF2019 domain-containing protein [Rhodopseudomonas sp.]